MTKFKITYKYNNKPDREGIFETNRLELDGDLTTDDGHLILYFNGQTDWIEDEQGNELNSISIEVVES